MNFKIGDSRTWQLFRRLRLSKKKQEAHQALSIEKVFKRLGWKPRAGLPNDMKEVAILAPCIAGGKNRATGDTVAVQDLVALELITLKVAELKLPKKGEL